MLRKGECSLGATYLGRVAWERVLPGWVVGELVESVVVVAFCFLR